tara:strand:- start:326 stop:508 length:183 start_codon:yes stop_codon:yes gene_type:complete
MIIIFLCLVGMLLGILGWKIYQMQNTINDLRDDMIKFQRSESIKREIGWDSVWKMVNRDT